MSLADLIKRRTGHTSHTRHTTKNEKPEREPSDALVMPDDQPAKPPAPAHEAETIQASRSGLVSDHPSWTDWIAEQCPLLLEDRQYVFLRLRTLPPRSAERAARRYVETWHAAATAEPKPHAKDNRGRTAANRTLLALIR